MYAFTSAGNSLRRLLKVCVSSEHVPVSSDGTTIKSAFFVPFSVASSSVSGLRSDVVSVNGGAGSPTSRCVPTRVSGFPCMVIAAARSSVVDNVFSFLRRDAGSRGFRTVAAALPSRRAKARRGDARNR